jgi:competence protein ComFC
MATVLNNLVLHLLDYFFPSRCINCSSTISHDDDYLCKKCYQGIEYLTGVCSICSGELIEDQCGICSGRKLYIDKNITIAEYSGVVKEILHNYKFNKRQRLHKLIFSISEEEINKYRDLFDLVTCVPINRKKKWSRGFNQSELIAKNIAEKLNKRYCSILKERYHFKTQKKLGYRDRFLNILGRYKIKNAKKVKGGKFLIVDDVFTTGATLNECARVLKSSGAEKVYSLTIAMTDIKRVDKIIF